MSVLKCEVCDHEFETFGYFVELNIGVIMCETCFMEFAIEKLNAKEMQLGIFGEIIDVKEEGKDFL